MKTWTQDELDALIACPKRTLDPPKNSMREEWGSYRNEATLESQDGLHAFRVFIRQNIMFPENFTVGLDFIPRDERGSVCLLRCNGPHGPHLLWPHHVHYHVHKAHEENLKEGRKAEAFAEVTEAYACLEEAIRHFGRLCAIMDWEDYYPSERQMLFEETP